MTLNNKQLTIADIAKGAGVSKTTVSRYINGKYEYMSENTRKRIEAIIQVANYQPNGLARSLKSQKTMLIGLVVADIESPFSSAIIKGAGDMLRSAGYSLIIVNSDNSYEKEKEYIQSLIAQRVDGLIVNTTSTNNPFLIDLANQGMPIVLADRLVKDYNFDIIHIENKIAIFSAVQHILDSGYSRAAFFTQPYSNVSPRFLRRDAFWDAVAQLGCSDPEKYIFEIDIADSASIPTAIKRLLKMCSEKATPPAVIAANGVTLLHIINVLSSLGLKPPNDIGLCGYDDWGWAPDMGWASMIAPGITTLSASSHSVGVQSAQLLLKRLSDRKTPKMTIAEPAPLIIRGSTKYKKIETKQK